MKLIHTSDTHGTFPTLPNGDVVVHSGDGLPNASRGNLNIEPGYQSRWVQKNLETYRDWLGGKPLIYCQGNHCFISPCDILKANGIDAVDITNKLYEWNGLKFYGFPFIPYIEGEWAHERRLMEMAQEISRLKDILLEGVDVLVAHCPIANVLDYDGGHWGNTLMANLFFYDLEEKYWPKYYLTGHIHLAHGSAQLGDMIISNAATRVHVIDLDAPPQTG